MFQEPISCLGIACLGISSALFGGFKNNAKPQWKDVSLASKRI
jgi:hypothetical protein